MSNLYEELGGEQALDAAVELFYQKVLNDQQLMKFFAATDMERLKKMQKSFLTIAFGGPNNYSGRGMRAAHEKAVNHGLNDEHFDAVIMYLGETLTELGVPQDKIQQAAGIAESVRDDVLNKVQSVSNY